MTSRITVYVRQEVLLQCMTSLTTKNERKSVIVSAKSHYKRRAKSFFCCKARKSFYSEWQVVLEFYCDSSYHKVRAQSVITKCERFHYNV